MKIFKRPLWIGCGVVLLGLMMLLWWKYQGTLPIPTDDEREKRPAVTVRTARAKRGSIQAWVFAEGTVRSARREYLTFENPGRVDFIRPSPGGKEFREGDPVKAGALLAHQDQRQYLTEIRTAEFSMREAGTQLAVAKAELEQTRTDETLARTTFRRFEVLLNQKSASRQEYDEAQAQAAKTRAAIARADSQVAAAEARVAAAAASLAQTKVELEKTELRSKIDGVVAYLNIEIGYYFTPGYIRTDDESAALQTVPIVVIDPNKFEVTVNVPAYERQRIKPGQPAMIATSEQSIEMMVLEQQTAPAMGDEASASAALPLESPVRGEVFSVNPAISPGGRAIQVKIRTVEDDARLEDGMFVTVWIATEQRENVIVAPMNSFTYRDNQPFVFIVEPETNTALLRPVMLGLQGFGVQEILAGVEEADLLVTDGRFQLSDKAHVRVLRHSASTLPEAPGHE